MNPSGTIFCACGAPAVCVDPGDPTEISPATDIVVARGRPVSGRCLACWPVADEREQRA